MSLIEDILEGVNIPAAIKAIIIRMIQHYPLLDQIVTLSQNYIVESIALKVINTVQKLMSSNLMDHLKANRLFNRLRQNIFH